MRNQRGSQAQGEIKRSGGNRAGGGREIDLRNPEKVQTNTSTQLESQDSDSGKMKEFTVKNILNNLENMLPCLREQLCVVQCLLGQNHLSVFSVQRRAFPPPTTTPPTGGRSPAVCHGSELDPAASLIVTCMFVK